MRYAGCVGRKYPDIVAENRRRRRVGEREALADATADDELTLDEATGLTPLGRQSFLNEIESGRLKARRESGVWYIQHADMDAWLASLPDAPLPVSADAMWSADRLLEDERKVESFRRGSMRRHPTGTASPDLL